MCSFLKCVFSSQPSLQSRDSELLQELSSVPLHVSQRVEALLEHRDRNLLALWQNGPPRRIVTDSLPRFLSLLQHASLLGQQELRSESREMILISRVSRSEKEFRYRR